MKALRIIGGNINQIAKKANETHSVYADDVGKLQKEVHALFRTLSQSLSGRQSTERTSSPLQPSLYTQPRKDGRSCFNIIYQLPD